MRYIYFTLLCIFVCTLTCCEKEEDITIDSLPRESRTFLSTYFENVPIKKIEKRRENPHYKIALVNGFTLFFYSEGGCQCINSDNGTIPQGAVYAMLPGVVTTYVYAHYPESSITLISVEEYGYYLELGTSPVVALRFDREGGVITLTYKS